MPLNLNGPQQGRLREALVDAFRTPADIEMLVQDQFSLNLHTVVGAGDITKHFFDLIRYMDQRGRLDQLVQGARAQNPGNLKLLDFIASIGLSAAGKPELEKVVSRNDVFLDVERWRALLEEHEYRVGRVEIGGEGLGTAFLVGPDLVLTNHHVVESIIEGGAAGWGVRFDYKVGLDGASVSAGTHVEFAEEWLVDHSPYSPLDKIELAERGGEEPGPECLDFALVRLRRAVGDEPRRASSPEARGFIKVRTQKRPTNSIVGVAILQHPAARPLKLALGLPETLTENATGTRWRYQTPTEGGSSGSPVFDTDWKLIALHHSGDPKKIKPSYNEAIPIHLIAARPAVKTALGI